MEYRLLGRTGVRVSRLGLGTMMFGGRSGADERTAATIVNRCLDAGVNLIDTADTYGRGDSERFVGAALGARRDEVVLTTKCFFSLDDVVNRSGGSRRWIVTAVEESLRRLGTDRIDVLQLHRLDPATDVEESLAALDDLVRQGKILYGGTSGASGSQLVECQWVAQRSQLRRPVLEETQYSVFTRSAEVDVLPTCRRHGIGVLVYGPLNGGWLAGKYARGVQPDPGSRAARRFAQPAWWDQDRPAVQRKLDLVEKLQELAAGAGITVVDLALGFAAAHPAVSSVLIGPRTPEQLETLLASRELPADVLSAIDTLVDAGTDVDVTDFVRVPAPA